MSLSVSFKHFYKTLENENEVLNTSTIWLYLFNRNLYLIF